MKNTVELVYAVIEQIKTDIAIGDYTAIAEMLEQVPPHILEVYLPKEL